MGHISVATIDKPEFINVQPMNPLISECEIKVLYVGKNRNKTFISEETARQIANTLPGCPIVGYYSESKEDFREHSERVTIDDDGFHFECLTSPYGFVAPDAKVWFQNFEDEDGFGNKIIRKYLMTTGYLWTGQFKEAQKIFESSEGRPQSMELDGESLEGEWAEDYNEKCEFFIINDAIFSKLCILGEDVEPCFEGSAITEKKLSLEFSKNSNKFEKTLFSMMNELKYALQGGSQLKMQKENILETEDKKDETFSSENQNITEDNLEDYKKKDEDESKNKSESKSKKEEDSKEEEKKENSEEKNKNKDNEDDKKDDKSESESKEEEEEKKKKKFSLEEENEELIRKCEKLEKDNARLFAFVKEVQDKEKDKMIDSFYMLTDEDKKDVIENKDKYSLDDIEAKLSILCVRKKVSFDLHEEKANESKPAVTFSLEDTMEEETPAWIKAVEKNRKKK